MAELIKEDFIKNIVESITSELDANILDAKRVTRQGATQQSPGLDLSNLTLIISAVIKGLIPVIQATIRSALQEEKVKSPPPDVNKDIIKLKVELDNANQYSRKDSCRISGLPEENTDGGEESDESLVKKVVELGEKTGANIS